MRLAVVMSSPILFPADRRTGACLLHAAHLRGHRLWCLPPETISEEAGGLVGLAYDVDFPIKNDLGIFWRRLQARVASRPPVPLDIKTLDATGQG